jgi:hypothetical protein
MYLQELLDTVIQQGRLTASRIPPMRTAVKQYAAILGTAAAHCPPEVYQLPSERLTALVNANAPATLGQHAVRNLKNNIRFLLQQGIDLGYLTPPDTGLHSWREARRVAQGWKPKRGEQGAVAKYALWPLPPPLAAEFQAFAEWSSASYAPDRPRRLQKRAISLFRYERFISRIAGFAHRVQGLDAERLTLIDITDPERLNQFAAWWIARRGKVTITIHHTLAYLMSMAIHWLKDAPRALAIKAIQERLPHPEVVHDKRRRWISLAQVEKAAGALCELFAHPPTAGPHPPPPTERPGDAAGHQPPAAAQWRVAAQIPWRGTQNCLAPRAPT